MADQLYLSLWYPNFRFANLPAALIAVLRQFATVASAGGATQAPYKRVAAASAYPLAWTESPVFQRVYVNDPRAAETADTEASIIENAVREATEQLHEDSAYEFEMRWGLWVPERGLRDSKRASVDEADDDPDETDPDARLDAGWQLEPTRVRLIGFGPEFDNGTFETNGHIRVDFGLDTPFTLEGEEDASEDDADDAAPIDEAAALRVKQNVEKLLAFTLLVEKNCGISSRLLWTESGEPLAEKLIARLQRLN